jgi:hypothetical protein
MENAPAGLPETFSSLDDVRPSPEPIGLGRAARYASSRSGSAIRERSWSTALVWI